MAQKYLLDTNICVHLFRGRQKAQMRRDGHLIEDMDLFIGATAVAETMTMVTENVSHLSRIQGIRLENWIVRQ